MEVGGTDDPAEYPPFEPWEPAKLLSGPFKGSFTRSFKGCFKRFRVLWSLYILWL